MRAKSLPLYLPADVYSRLEHAAQMEERDPIQQARWIIRRALDTVEDQPKDRHAVSADAT